MFEQRILNNSHLDKILEINSNSATVYGSKKEEHYDKVYANWIKEVISPSNKNANILGVFLDDELVQYSVYYKISTWPAVVLDHWRSDTKHKNKGIIAATEWTKLFADFIAQQGIYTWYIVVEKEMWDRYTRLQKKRYEEEPPNYRFLLEEIPPGEKSKSIAFNTYILRNQIYPKTMYVFQMINKDKYY